MKAEVEFEFEPSLVVEMSTDQENGTLVNYAHVKKDRSDKINGKDFKMPKFKDFEPHFSCLNLGGEHVGVEYSEEDMNPASAEISEKINENKTTNTENDEETKDKKPGPPF